MPIESRVGSGSYRGAAPGFESMRRALLDSARINAEQQFRLRERASE